jgi:hypothetical protein
LLLHSRRYAVKVNAGRLAIEGGLNEVLRLTVIDIFPMTDAYDFHDQR